jgi:hypothetical protein
MRSQSLLFALQKMHLRGEGHKLIFTRLSLVCRLTQEMKVN